VLLTGRSPGSGVSTSCPAPKLPSYTHDTCTYTRRYDAVARAVLDDAIALAKLLWGGPAAAAAAAAATGSASHMTHPSSSTAVLRQKSAALPGAGQGPAHSGVASAAVAVAVRAAATSASSLMLRGDGDGGGEGDDVDEEEGRGVGAECDGGWLTAELVRNVLDETYRSQVWGVCVCMGGGQDATGHCVAWRS
jgi:hypothetical protein